MSTLQKTIGYGGAIQNAPTSKVDLQFQFPVYEYTLDEGDKNNVGGVVRQVAGTDSVSLNVALSASEYRVNLGDAFLTGNNKALFLQFVKAALTAKSLDTLSVGIEVLYFVNERFAIGKESLELIYFPKMALESPQRRVAVDVVDSLLLIDKDAFLALLKKMTSAGAVSDPIVLLTIISMLTDPAEKLPTLNRKISASVKESLLALLTKMGIDNAASAFDAIKGGFDALFDIRLTIPEIKSVELGGTFTVLTSDGSTITPQDLLSYELTAEYSISETGELQILRYRFDDSATIEANATTFSFTNSRKLLRESIAGTISVKVKGIDDSILWAREFKPADPGLDNLDIEVPLQRAGYIVPADNANVPAVPKKLRGQVLELTKHCALKDLTVLIQAKVEGEDNWRIVGAGKTDNGGNFSIAYPYGIYTAAQAIVSLTPDAPVSIAITEVKHGNQTISDAFLYLWVRDAKCTPEKDDDCDCHSPKKASRLPDYADLIGSDQYSQDIGGACVNLSTPNRTLSEFNYQAIVRTSDPEVANYTLRRVDPSVTNVSTTLNNLTSANTTTNSLLGAISGLNAQLNAALSPLDAAVYASSNSTLMALNEVMKPLNAALEPLHEAPVAALSAALTALGAAATASDTLNTALNSAMSPIQEAINAANAAANIALTATLTSAPPEATGLFGFLTGTQNAGANALFNPLNPALASAMDTANAVLVAQAKATLNTALGAANVALNAALAASKGALNAALDAASSVSSADATTRYELVGGSQKIARKSVDLDNPIGWYDVPEEPTNAAKSPFGNLRKYTPGQFSKVSSGDSVSSPNKSLSFYQAVTVATGHILHYKSLFKADGYSLGDLVYSLPLAPGQKKEIVVFDSSHTLQGGESQALSQGESLSANIANEREILTQLSGTLSESMRGSSSANTSGISAGLGTGGQGYGGTQAYGGSGSAVIGVAGGTANSNSIAAQDSSRNVSQFFADKLRQSIMQNAESYRQANASVVTTVQEGQRYGVTSEVVANHNHCHALTMMYFEVLRHYAIFQELSSVEECVFVPLLMTHFTSQNIYKWRDVLAPFLLPMPSETYLPAPTNSNGEGRQHPLLRAFDANERIKTKYANVDFPEGSYDDEQIQFLRGSLRLTVNLPRPRTRFDRIMSFPLTKQLDAQAMAGGAMQYATDMASYSAKAAATAGIFTLFEKPPTPPNPAQYEVVAREAIFDTFMSLDANYQTVAPADCIRIKNFNPPALLPVGLMDPLRALITSPTEFFADNIDDREQWKLYADLLGYPDVLTMLNAYFAGNLISEWDTIFYTDIAPLIFEKIVSSLRISELSTDFSSESKYKGGERQMRLNLTATTTRKRNQLPLQLIMSVNNSTIKALQKYVTLNADDLTITYSTSHFNGVLYSGSINDDLLDNVRLYIPESSEEKRNPRKEDAYLAGKLIEHLNSHLEHYNKVLWFNLDPDRRYMLLDGFGIQTYNRLGKPLDENGQPIPLRSLASVVKNELITITGNSMVFPVAAGYRVSKDYIVEQLIDEEPEDGEETQRKVTLLDHYQPLTPIEPYRISVPSKGVFVEAVQGACNACEKIETERLQDWNRFPNTDEPTAISPVTPPVPAITDWKAAFKDFATPIVNIQNAPATPAPGEGMAALSELLGKSGVFKDITGLEGNQANVIKTYQSNQENAKSFAEMAKEMAMQTHNTQNTDKIMDSLQAAKDSGALTQAEYSKLVKDHMQQLIDGGETKKAEIEKDKKTSEEEKAVTETIRNIPHENIQEVDHTTPDGTKTTVKATPKAPSKGLRKVIVSLKSSIVRSGETGGAPLNGNLSIGFGLPGTETTTGGEFRRVTFPIFTGVDAQEISLRAETYILRPSYKPASRGDLTFLTGLNLGIAGVDVPDLITRVWGFFTQDMSQLTSGVVTKIAPTQTELKLGFNVRVRKMDEGNAVTLKLDGTAGFSFANDGKVSFDSTQLGALVAKLAPFLRDPRAVAVGEGVAALLSLFTVTSNISSTGKITGDIADGVQIKLVPALMEEAELTVLK